MTTAPRLPSPSLRALVAGLVDYAGLFPPASLDMTEAAAHYAEHQQSPQRWMLGRFVAPVARLDELAAAAAPHRAPGSAPWRVSALLGDEVLADAARIEAFNLANADALVVDVAEARAASEQRIEAVVRALGSDVVAYLELPHDAEPRPLLEVVQRVGARAKIRTGGVTADAFPTAPRVARFIARCAELGVPFKATAGLHHPLRGEHRLTYQANAASATMFGFLNVFVAGALAASGVAEAELVDVLEERASAAFDFGTDVLLWRNRHVTLEQLVAARASFAVAFGSCSFREPVDDLHELALL